MYSIRAEKCFDSAHFLKGYQGRCHNIHGHRWKVIAEVRGTLLSEEEQTRGMLFDFSDLKTALGEVCDQFDHCLIYEKDSLKEKTIEALKEEDFALSQVPFRPTAENFARYFFEKLSDRGFPVFRMEVYETPDNCAIYEEEK